MVSRPTEHRRVARAEIHICLHRQMWAREDEQGTSALRAGIEEESHSQTDQGVMGILHPIKKRGPPVRVPGHPASEVYLHAWNEEYAGGIVAFTATGSIRDLCS